MTALIKLLCLIFKQYVKLQYTCITTDIMSVTTQNEAFIILVHLYKM